jgi:hypothetical protein
MGRHRIYGHDISDSTMGSKRIIAGYRYIRGLWLSYRVWAFDDQPS